MRHIYFIVNVCLLYHVPHLSAVSINVGKWFTTQDTFPNAYLTMHKKENDGSDKEVRRFLPGDPPIVQTATGCIYQKFANDYRLEGGFIGFLCGIFFMIILSFVSAEKE
jgi:hypothetical protein